MFPSRQPFELVNGDPFDALGDANRRAIVERLAVGERSVQELADDLPISRPAVSRHLRLLKEAGLVTDRSEGTRRLYRLQHDGVDAVRNYLEQVWGDALTRFKLYAENTEPPLMTDALVVQVDVACTVSHAFDTWTKHIDSWWPKDHSTSADPATTVTIEPHAGGRIYEVTSAGDEIDWGEIEVWHPPNRLVYLWYIASDRADATTVDVTFTSTAAGTAVRVEQRGWERLGVTASERRSGNERGWSAVLPHFVAACATP